MFAAYLMRELLLSPPHKRNEKRPPGSPPGPLAHFFQHATTYTRDRAQSQGCAHHHCTTTDRNIYVFLTISETGMRIDPDQVLFKFKT
jgi:hypothetical protein